MYPGPQGGNVNSPAGISEEMNQWLLGSHKGILFCVTGMPSSLCCGPCWSGSPCQTPKPNGLCLTCWCSSFRTKIGSGQDETQEEKRLWTMFGNSFFVRRKPHAHVNLEFFLNQLDTCHVFPITFRAIFFCIPWSIQLSENKHSRGISLRV